MPIPEDHGQATIFFTGTGAPRGAAITWGFFNGTAQTAAQCASDVVNAVTTSTLIANLSSAVATTKVRVKLGPDINGPFAEQAMSLGGGASANAQSPQVSYLVEKQTALGGRRNRGRFFLPGVSEVDADSSGQVLAATVTAINTDLTALLVDLAARDVDMMVLHSDGGPPTQVTSLTLDPFTATQRRRLRG